MKHLYFLIILLAAGLAARAQQNLDVSLVPKQLLPYASSVIRYCDESVQVDDPGSQTYRIKKAITIFNSSGDSDAEILVWHDKSTSIRSIKGLVYDGSGKLLSKFSESNFEDAYAGNNFSLFEDTRVMHFRPAVVDYPYTIAYEYETREKQTLYFSRWLPANNTNMAVEHSTFTFICKPGFNIRYKEVNLPVKVQTGTNKAGMNTFTWQVSNLKATREEPYSADPETFLAMVKIAPVNFKYGALNGSFNNWNELGKWMYTRLLAGRQVLAPATVADVKELVKDIPDEKARAKKIYEYMQQRTRYISIQIGIGGFQPFPATDVDRLNYGDCKALVNYTQALLAAANIPSYYCVVEAGSRKVNFDPVFASMNDGNHVILCLPFKNDTTWLECTSQKMPFGYLGDFTDDRTVLACTPEGGMILHTPKYIAEKNLQVRKAELTLDSAGEVAGSMKTVYKGTQYENQEELTYEAPADQLKQIKKTYHINNLEIGRLKFDKIKNIYPELNEELQFSARNYASIAGSKLHFTPNLANRSRGIREVRNRLTDVCIQRGYTDEDEIIYTLPANNYRHEKKPIAISIDKPFGKYTASLTLQGNKLIYKRNMKLIDGTYPKETYAEMVKFFEDIVDADNYSAILVKE
ncbi:DUF3857 domain-containing protein [Mucilaginibacter sp. UR6-1]|uniref:DUF3857 domain-containing protein n=1 Tax=Mucilaginibacter sp. UR6-1 TaxID=1435643 RepID=UPI001E2EBD43|nr:DUF3857 domain-containing protein [Mucilaginibacter sp. UR6-1]MCC8410261.1 DUF3857 domain-containing protein [Mucilaginibacter sp. UR6-1]